jgi:hypothetical protein
MRGDGTNVGPVFNGLRLTRGPGQGDVILGFNGYAEPNGAFQYIVKASAVSGNSGEVNIVFSEFRSDGILVKVLRNGAPVPSAQIAQIEVMVEISQILTN